MLNFVGAKGLVLYDRLNAISGQYLSYATAVLISKSLSKMLVEKSVSVLD